MPLPVVGAALPVMYGAALYCLPDQLITVDNRASVGKIQEDLDCGGRSDQLVNVENRVSSVENAR